MATTALSAKDFEETVTTYDMVLVDWWASWCGPCRMFAPVYEQVSTGHPEMVFGKVDTEAESGLASAAGISSIPTLMAFREGMLVFSQPGALSAADLERVITAVSDLDMDDLRTRAAARQEDAPTNTSTTDIATLRAAWEGGATVIDVREKQEYDEGHVPGARLIPLGQVPDRLDEMPRDELVYVICRSGHRSEESADFLNSRGYQALSVDGGTMAWIQAGLPVDR
ncbi:MAG: thioredoxin domain-containing protein [Dermatophilaceae bacterium]